MPVIIMYKISKRLKSPDLSRFEIGGITFPTERIQSLTVPQMRRQGRLFIRHYIHHQLHAKPKAFDEHIPLRD